MDERLVFDRIATAINEGYSGDGQISHPLRMAVREAKKILDFGKQKKILLVANKRYRQELRGVRQIVEVPNGPFRCVQSHFCGSILP